jgi:hypothetical protein
MQDINYTTALEKSQNKMLNQVKKNKIKELTTIGTIGHKKNTKY